MRIAAADSRIFFFAIKNFAGLAGGAALFVSVLLK
jgi:hypothetical protein